MNRSKIKTKDLEWAHEAIRDVVLSCVLNITLRNGQVCSKYLYEMNDQEGEEYFRMVHELFDVDKKKS